MGYKLTPGKFTPEKQCLQIFDVLSDAKKLWEMVIGESLNAK